LGLWVSVSCEMARKRKWACKCARESTQRNSQKRDRKGAFKSKQKAEARKPSKRGGGQGALQKGFKKWCAECTNLPGKKRKAQGEEKEKKVTSGRNY